MNVLGISAHYHDAAAALVVDGKVVAAAAEERFTRLKHDVNYPQFAIDFCLRQAGLTPDDLDEVVYYEEPYVKFGRVLASSLARFPFSRRVFMESMKAWLSHKLWTKNEISASLGVHPGKVTFVPHHLSHAAYSFLTSGYENAAILTVDAVGEWVGTALGAASWKGGLSIELSECLPYPHSLGLVYAAFTGFLGFRPNDAECSTMALAAFGTPCHADRVRQVLQPQPDGTYVVDSRFFDFTRMDGLPFTSRFVKLFGEPRHFLAELPFDALNDQGWSRTPTEAEQYYADLAASVQLVLQEVLLGLANRLHKATGLEKLCLAGGVALNAVANTVLATEGPFSEIYIPPDPGDAGSAVGAALLGYYRQNAGGPPERTTPFLGGDYDASQVEAMLGEIDPEDWNEHLRPGCVGVTREQLQVQRPKEHGQLIQTVVDDLRNGRVVGWFQSRFEVGPRALGNRSILIDPANVELARRLSRTVKSRAAYRPYALSIADEDAHGVLELNGRITQPARWMQMVFAAQPKARNSVRAALHVDHTTRAQICSAEDNQSFHELLRAFGGDGRPAALLNTSFNEDGYPLVASPMEALLVFARTDMDTLVLNNLLVRKVRL